MVGWSPTARLSGKDYRTPDLSPVVAEIVGRSGWRGGNRMVLIVGCTDGVALKKCGSRSTASYNGKSGHAPLLVVTYDRESVDGSILQPQGTELSEVLFLPIVSK